MKKIMKKDELENWRTTNLIRISARSHGAENINEREQLATAALSKMNNIQYSNSIKDKIEQSLRLKLCRSVIKPVPLYNSGTRSPTKKEEEQLDAFYRKQSRRKLMTRPGYYEE